MTWLTEPLGFEFMRHALIISVMVGATAGALSTVLVLKGWALMGDAVSHAVLPGVVLAYIVGAPLAIGAFAAGLICAVASGFIAAESRVKPDTAMGVVFSGMFGLGVVMFTAIETDVHLDHILFGDMLGISWSDIAQTGAIAAFTLAVLTLKRRDLMLFTFDPAHARVVGLPVRAMHYGLLALMSLTIVAALKAVGLILAIALLIGPGAIAFLLTQRFERMMALSSAVAAAASAAGVILSFHIDSAPAPTIVVILTALFILVFLFAPREGVLRRHSVENAETGGAPVAAQGLRPVGDGPRPALDKA